MAASAASAPAHKAAADQQPGALSSTLAPPYSHYIIIRDDLPRGHFAAQLNHASAESASWWTADRCAESIGRELLAGDEPEDTPVWTKDHVREALDPLTGWCGNKAIWCALPDTTHAIILAARDEFHLREIAQKLGQARYADESFPKHILICEPDAPYNGAATAIGIYPTRNRAPLKKLLSTLPLIK